MRRLAGPFVAPESGGEPSRRETRAARDADATVLTEARRESESLNDELATTRECLKDARAAAARPRDQIYRFRGVGGSKEKKVLSKEIRLRRQVEEARLDTNEQANIISAEDRVATLRDVMHEVSVLADSVQSAAIKLLSIETGVRTGTRPEIRTATSRRERQWIGGFTRGDAIDDSGR